MVPIKSVSKGCIVSANRCNVCFFESFQSCQTNSSLYTCQGCKLLSYCGAEHQKLDWPIHKEFCKAVQIVLKTNNVSHPHLIHGSIQSKLDLQKAVINFKKLLLSELGRRLEPFEEEFINCPRYCNNCLSFKTFKQYDCAQCHIVAYCSAQCRAADSPEHSKDCTSLKIYYNYWQEEIVNFDMVKKSINFQWTSTSFDLFDLLRKLSTKNIYIPKWPNSLEAYNLFASACDYSYVATILFIFHYCRLLHNLKNVCTIYIVGAREDFYFFSEAHCILLLSQLPQISKLNLIFVGPELLRTESMQFTFFAEDKKKEIKLQFYAEKFERYFERTFRTVSNEIVANLVICFNCGFSEFSNSKSNTWSPVLNLFLNFQRTPIAFTSYTYLESKLDLKEMCQDDGGSKSEVLIRCMKNPYRDYRPIRNWEVSDEADRMFHRNNFLSVVLPNPNVIQAEAVQD